MTDKIKSCPFCGGDNVGVFQYRFHSKEDLYSVHCYDCHFGLKAVETEEEAIKQWNTRKPMDRIVEALENQSHTWKPSSKEWWKPSNTTISLKKAIEIVKAGGKDE